MPKEFRISIVTPKGSHYEGVAELATFDIFGGTIGVMANIIPLASPIKVSKLIFEKKIGDKRIGVIGDGLLLTEGENVTLVVNEAI
jgi:F0F1-type ATP synthase epsilon subunit